MMGINITIRSKRKMVVERGRRLLALAPPSQEDVGKEPTRSCNRIERANLRIAQTSSLKLQRKSNFNSKINRRSWLAGWTTNLEPFSR
jgi:hypothetical protein